MARLIFLGPPGAGKGTQAHLIAQEQEIPHISTGEILRDAVKRQTELGQKAQSYMNKGELVPDPLIIQMVRDRLTQNDVKAGWILDGFPRTASQATFLDELLQDINQSCDRVVNFDVPDEVLVRRLLERSVKEGRQDDTEEVIRRRLEVYRQQTAPLIDFYRERNQLVSVNGDQPVEAVTVELHHAIQSS